MILVVILALIITLDTAGLMEHATISLQNAETNLKDIRMRLQRTIAWEVVPTSSIACDGVGPS